MPIDIKIMLLDVKLYQIFISQYFILVTDCLLFMDFIFINLDFFMDLMKFLDRKNQKKLVFWINHLIIFTIMVNLKINFIIMNFIMV